MAAENNLESDIKAWLKIILEKENLIDLSVKISGKGSKADGTLGDIVFVHASGTTENERMKEYDLVLKCSKQSQALREDQRFKDTFINEIYIYDKLLPLLIQFQHEQGLDKIFDNVPKCYGTLVQEHTEIIALENLKSSGYELCPRQEPLTRNHIDLVMEAYGKFHATSAAFKELYPVKHQEIVTSLKQNLQSFANRGVGIDNLKKCIEDASEVLKDDLHDSTLKKWKSLGENLQMHFKEMQKADAFRVFVHGDCWSNNFMFKYEDEDKSRPTGVVILDWQVTRSAMLISDLSFFLFCCISEKDVNNIEDILTVYYEHFSNHLAKFGIDADVLYPMNQFLHEWKQYCKFGIIFASLTLRSISVDEEDVVDVAEAAEKGKGFGDSFVCEMKDKDKVIFKNRMRYLVDYVVEHGLI